ncbi:MAG: DNA damage-inducible protein D [Proteobacteria bacterium]|nr:DNA damage-inducible protein D [Pseudomonadota bacterium]
MIDKRIEQRHRATFDAIRHQDERGNDFWFARDLAPLLEYQQWRNFVQVVEKAKLACRQAGNAMADHFADISKMVDIGSGARRELADVKLSRYACYLIVQNGDPAKPVITSLDCAIFQDHGYKGLYGGLAAKEIHARKGLKKSQKILDHMGSTELAANLFRATQTEEKLKRDRVRGKQRANQTHYEVGKKVRQTIHELGGTMPELLLAPERSIGQIASAKKKLGKDK